MLQRLSWLKIGVVMLLIVLFFVIVNGFFNENKNLLKERIFWQEKAKSLQELYNQAQAENEALRGEVEATKKGLLISGIKLESVEFIRGNGNNVTYSLIIEVVNKSKQRSAGATGFVIFSRLNQGEKNISSTSWRSFALPALNSGETKAVKLSGKISGRSQAKIIIFANILGEPGLAKLRATLPKKPVAVSPSPKREELRPEETMKEKPREAEPKREEAQEEEAKEETPKNNEEPEQGESPPEEKETPDSEQPAPPASELPPEEPGADSETVS